MIIMSDVRVSNGSPTMERMMDAARLSDQPKPSACRTLFGPVDHDELKRDLTAHLSEMEEAAAEQWEFDFSTHTPRQGAKFLWTLVDSAELPGFYTACPAGNNALDVNGNCGITAEKKEDRTEKQTDKRKRPACIDSSCPVKRSRSCLDEPPHTPRKCSPTRHT
ncbi:cyclin-dependent kinase inhibitor 1Bb [Silurus meridionalis]|uniref:Cyclin-dependent kinase inhibitor 1B n=1 Tax=Silurus meridionalis TaxID=175797 RepID=A0A8T0BAE8_SILME|nr:cyclin-dependent kinase inhibitor 1Bb [Silurus meridionalis]KAF7701878.1 hypothetical protein HF521_001161 [Silurus meridionalis]